MANTTSIVTTITKAANKEKTPKEADAALKVNILDFCEEHYEDILLVIMDKIRRAFEKKSMLGWTSEKVPRKSAFDRLSDTYFPSTTKSGSDKVNSRDRSHSRGRPRRRDSSLSRDRPRSRDRLREELYGNTCSSHRTWAKHKYHSRDNGCSRSMKRGRKANPCYLACRRATPAMKDTGSQIQKDTSLQVERWAMPTWCHMFNSTLIGIVRVWFDELPSKNIDGYKDIKAAFLAYFMQQKKYVKDLVEIHNIKQRDGETIEDFIERFKVKTGRMKGDPECMRISGFMHGVNNPE
nr:reverse transcriptase domain-containing protein [Tanacetum cinerariifolium]